MIPNLAPRPSARSPGKKWRFPLYAAVVGFSRESKWNASRSPLFLTIRSDWPEQCSRLNRIRQETSSPLSAPPKRGNAITPPFVGLDLLSTGPSLRDLAFALMRGKWRPGENRKRRRSCHVRPLISMTNPSGGGGGRKNSLPINHSKLSSLISQVSACARTFCEDLPRVLSARTFCKDASSVGRTALGNWVFYKRTDEKGETSDENWTLQNIGFRVSDRARRRRYILLRIFVQTRGIGATRYWNVHEFHLDRRRIPWARLIRSGLSEWSIPGTADTSCGSLMNYLHGKPQLSSGDF